MKNLKVFIKKPTPSLWLYYSHDIMLWKHHSKRGFDFLCGKNFGKNTDTAGSFYIYLSTCRGSFYLEKHITTDYHLIHTAIDDKIPFIEYFIVPYTLWFLFIAVTVGYFFFFGEKSEFYRLIILLFSGMTIFLIVSTIYPNGLQLRPETFTRDNIFVDMVRQLYAVDTSTNVLPSIHVYNSLGAYIAISHCSKLKQYKWVQIFTLLLTISIILSTMFLKQHSVIDVVAAFFMAGIMYVIVYRPIKVRDKNSLENLA